MAPPAPLVSTALKCTRWFLRKANCTRRFYLPRPTHIWWYIIIHWKELKHKLIIYHSRYKRIPVASLELKIDGCNLCPITVIRHNLHKIAQNWRVQLAFLKNRRVHLHPSHPSKEATAQTFQTLFSCKTYSCLDLWSLFVSQRSPLFFHAFNMTRAF